MLYNLICRLGGICRRPLVIFIEIMVIILLVAGIAGGLLMWRLTSGPIDLSFAKTYIEDAIQTESRDYEIDFKDAKLVWFSFKAPVKLELRDLTLSRDDRILLEIFSLEIDLSKRNLIFGKIRPKSLTVVKPRIKVIRRKDNTLAFDFNNSGETYDAISGDRPHSFLDIVSDLFGADKNTDTPAILNNLRSITIRSAVIIIEDRILSRSWHIPDAAFSLRRRNADLMIQASFEFPGYQKMTTISTKAVYTPASQMVAFDIFFDNANITGLARKFMDLEELANQFVPVNGIVSFKLGPRENLSTVSIDLESESGEINVPGIYDKSLFYKDLQIKAKASLEQARLQLETLSFAMHDQTFDFGSDLRFVNNVISGPLSVRMDTLDLSRMSDFWPEGVNEPKLERWIKRKLPRGTISNLEVGMQVLASKNQAAPNDEETSANFKDDWFFDIGDIKGGFDFENLTIDYEPSLIPITESKGSLDFTDNTLAITLNSGKIDEIDIKRAYIVITEVIGDAIGKAEIIADMQGPLKTVFDFIQREPIGFDNSKNIEASQLKGRTEFELMLSFPTLEDIPEEAFQFAVKGRAQDIFVPKVLKNLALSGGPFDVDIKTERFKVSGSGAMYGVPVTLSYTDYFESALDSAPFAVKAEAEFQSNLYIRERLEIDISEYLTGTAPTRLDYTEYKDGRAVADISMNVTDTILHEDSFGYRKPKGLRGEIRLKAHLLNDTLQKITNLSLDSETSSIEDGELVFIQDAAETKLQSGFIRNAVLDQNQFSMEFQHEADILKMKLSGKTLDARPFLESDKTPYTGPSIRMSGEFETMIADPEHRIQNTKLYMELDRAGEMRQLEMDGKAGGGDIYLRYKPNDEGRLTLHLEADNAGAALRAFDIYDNVEGGKLIIFAEPVGKALDGDLKGRATLQDFKAVRTPVLARLLGALSLPGIIELLNSDGLRFTELNSQFDWINNPDGDVYVFSNGRTTGNSLGLTFDGKYESGSDTINISGSIVPASEINALVSNIPLIGQLLAGDPGEGVFAANYSIKGQADDPEVVVNPLSVLTPGIFRKLFWGDSNKMPAKN